MATDEEGGPFHIGNEITITSSRDDIGTIKGTIIYYDGSVVRIMEDDVTDKAIEFKVSIDEDGTILFAEEDGITDFVLRNTFQSDYYVDFLGVKVGDTVEFFGLNGNQLREPNVVREVQRTTTKDSIVLDDGTVIKFKLRGPPEPFKIIRVLSSVTESDNAFNAEKREQEQAQQKAEEEAAEQAHDELLASLLAIPTPYDNGYGLDYRSGVGGPGPGPLGDGDGVPGVPGGPGPGVSQFSHLFSSANFVYPDQVQREDLYQSLLSELKPKQQTPKRLRELERRIDLFMSLKNKSIVPQSDGTFALATYSIDTVGEALEIANAPLPVAVPVVAAARVLNLDELGEVNDNIVNESNVVPRVLSVVEQDVDSHKTNEFHPFINYLLDDNQSVLVGSIVPGSGGWRVDQDVIRTADYNDTANPVQGLSSSLPPVKKDSVKVDKRFILKNIVDRSARVLTADRFRNVKTGEQLTIAKSDPNTILSYRMLPLKAALVLRPPIVNTDLPVTIGFAERLSAATIPTLTRSILDLDGESGPLASWNMPLSEASTTTTTSLIQEAFPFVVHPSQSLAPKTRAIRTLLDTLGIDPSQSSDVIQLVWDLVEQSQTLWNSLSIERRNAINQQIDAYNKTIEEQKRTQPDVAPLWKSLLKSSNISTVLRSSRNKTPTGITSFLLNVAQGDALPLVWAEIQRLSGIEPARLTMVDLRPFEKSQRFAQIHKDVKSLGIQNLVGDAPPINSCPHVNELEAIRNISILSERMSLLTKFIETYQGSRGDNWVKCVLCSANCVCYHEVLELEAFAQPDRLLQIEKQIMVQFGGERYEGHVICKVCGQALKEIEYDDNVEFDDDGKPVITGSVLTKEQLSDTFNTVDEEVGAGGGAGAGAGTNEDFGIEGILLQQIAALGGLQIPNSIFVKIVEYTQTFVELTMTPEAEYNAKRDKELKSKTTQIPTFSEVLNMTRLLAISAFIVFFLQTAIPPIQVVSKTNCAYTTIGFPLVDTDDATQRQSSPVIAFVSCVVALGSWDFLKFFPSDKTGDKSRAIRGGIYTTILKLLGESNLVFSFTPDLLDALVKARSDKDVIRERTIISNRDRLPQGFRPDPFPSRTQSMTFVPAPERTGAISVIDRQVQTGLIEQAVSIIRDLHNTETLHALISFNQYGMLQGPPEQPQLLNAAKRLRDAKGTILGQTLTYDMFESAQVRPVLDRSLLFKLFLKYCYSGESIGFQHEFSAGFVCRQCGFVLGEGGLMDIMDFVKDPSNGKDIETGQRELTAAQKVILANQQGELRIEATETNFFALTNSVRTRSIIPPDEKISSRLPNDWIKQLQMVARADKTSTFSIRLQAVLKTNELSAKRFGVGIDGQLGRATLWKPLIEYYDYLRNMIKDKMGYTDISIFNSFEELLNDPFIEGPRTLQEYWCSKVESAGVGFYQDANTIRNVHWEKYADSHMKLIGELVTRNSRWFGEELSDEARTVLAGLAKRNRSFIQKWIKEVKGAGVIPADGSNKPEGAWTRDIVVKVLATIVYEGWFEAINKSTLYAEVPDNLIDKTLKSVRKWIVGLLIHMRTQTIRFSKEEIKKKLQDRASLERDTIVAEFANITDSDMKRIEIIKKQMKMGRWAVGESVRGYDSAQFDHDAQQREHMGIGGMGGGLGGLDGLDGLGGGGEPEEGFDVNQAADGDDY